MSAAAKKSPHTYCPSCGVHWSQHHGPIGVCAELQMVKLENERLRKQIAETKDSPRTTRKTRSGTQP